MKRGRNLGVVYVTNDTIEDEQTNSVQQNKTNKHQTVVNHTSDSQVKFIFLYNKEKKRKEDKKFLSIYDNISFKNTYIQRLHYEKEGFSIIGMKKTMVLEKFLLTL